MFYETAKGECTTLQEGAHNPQAEDLPFTQTHNKLVTKCTAAIYQGKMWGIVVSRRESLRLSEVTAKGPTSMSNGPESGREELRVYA